MISLPKIVKRLSQYYIWDRSINVIKNNPLIFMSKFLAFKKLGVLRIFGENAEKSGAYISVNVKKFVLLYIILFHFFNICSKISCKFSKYYYNFKEFHYFTKLWIGDVFETESEIYSFHEQNLQNMKKIYLPFLKVKQSQR